jgi:excisionase family DNA binding protein
MTQSDDEGFYSAKEFMRIFKVANSSFYRMAKAGHIRIYKQGRASRIAKAEAKAWAASLPTFGGEARP